RARGVRVCPCPARSLATREPKRARRLARLRERAGPGLPLFGPKPQGPLRALEKLPVRAGGAFDGARDGTGQTYEDMLFATLLACVWGLVVRSAVSARPG